MVNKNNVFNMIFKESYSLHDDWRSEIEMKNNVTQLCINNKFKLFRTLEIYFHFVLVYSCSLFLFPDCNIFISFFFKKVLPIWQLCFNFLNFFFLHIWKSFIDHKIICIFQLINLSFATSFFLQNSNLQNWYKIFWNLYLPLNLKIRNI